MQQCKDLSKHHTCKRLIAARTNTKQHQPWQQVHRTALHAAPVKFQISLCQGSKQLPSSGCFRVQAWLPTQDLDSLCLCCSQIQGNLCCAVLSLVYTVYTELSLEQGVLTPSPPECLPGCCGSRCGLTPSCLCSRCPSGRCTSRCCCRGGSKGGARDAGRSRGARSAHEAMQGGGLLHC
jgi:hypothetical protein